MPTYTVALRVNVPGVGETTRNYPGLVAPDIAAAMALAVAMIVIEPVQVTKTA